MLKLADDCIEDRFFIFERKGNPARGIDAGGQDIGIGLLIIDVFNQPPCRKIGEADPHGVALGLLRQRQDRQRNGRLPGGAANAG